MVTTREVHHRRSTLRIRMATVAVAKRLLEREEHDLMKKSTAKERG